MEYGCVQGSIKRGCNVCVIAVTALLGLAVLAHSSSPCPGSFGRLVSCKDDWNRLPTLPRETSTPTWPRSLPHTAPHAWALTWVHRQAAAVTWGAQSFHILSELGFKRRKSANMFPQRNLAWRVVFTARRGCWAKGKWVSLSPTTVVITLITDNSHG